MKTKKLLILFLSLTSMNFAGKTQTQTTIDSIKVTYQSCLDKGDNMLACTYRYYHQMDSLLNVVYKNQRSKLDSTGKARLKAGQLKWLSQRDAYFKKLEKDLILKQEPEQWAEMKKCSQETSRPTLSGKEWKH